MNRIAYHTWLKLAMIAATPLVALGFYAAAFTSASPVVGNTALLVVAIASVLAALLHWAIVRAETREQAVARRYLELLGHLQDSTLSSLIGRDALPALDEQSPWYRPLNRIREYLTSIHERETELQAARTALEVRLQSKSQQSELMTAVLARLGEPVFVVDAYDELVLTNPDAERRLGATPDKRRLPQLAASDKLASMIADVRRRTVPSRRTDEIELTEAGGAKHWYRAAVEKLRASDGDGEHALVVLRDVSSERDVQRRHAEFVSAASHEMKTPLAGIKAYVELLADGEAESEADREEFLGVISNQAERLQRLIENLLNIARIEAGVVKVSKQSRSVNEILSETLNVVGPAAESKQIAITSDLSPLYLGALVDRDMLSQAVINLLSNAIKYTPCGGKVALRSRLCDHEIQIDVEDTGVGLSEDDCRRVFEKFYRVEKDKAMAPGTGLGLALAQHIVEDVHGGRLSVRSKLGEGSTFTISIPSAGLST